VCLANNLFAENSQEDEEASLIKEVSSAYVIDYSVTVIGETYWTVFTTDPSDETKRKELISFLEHDPRQDLPTTVRVVSAANNAQLLRRLLEKHQFAATDLSKALWDAYSRRSIECVLMLAVKPGVDLSFVMDDVFKRCNKQVRFVFFVSFSSLPSF